MHTLGVYAIASAARQGLVLDKGMAIQSTPNMNSLKLFSFKAVSVKRLNLLNVNTCAAGNDDFPELGRPSH
jgi:hypothetical protein